MTGDHVETILGSQPADNSKAWSDPLDGIGPLKELVNKEIVKARFFQMLNHTQNSFTFGDEVAISNFNIIAHIHSR